MIYMITLTDGRLFVTTSNNLDYTLSELKSVEDNIDDVDIEGPFPFVEVRSSGIHFRAA